jgi:hypothetical protein
MGALRLRVGSNRLTLWKQQKAGALFRIRPAPNILKVVNNGYSHTTIFILSSSKPTLFQKRRIY